MTGVFASGCGKWTDFDHNNPECRDNACYKVVWFKGSWGQTIYQKRQCVRDDNTTYWEYDNYTHWDGCCDK